MPKPLEVAVVYGIDAVDAYKDGTTNLEELRRLGFVKFYEFPSIAELNAFILGIEEAQEGLDAIAVDDLTYGRRE